MQFQSVAPFDFAHESVVINKTVWWANIMADRCCRECNKSIEQMNKSCTFCSRLCSNRFYNKLRKIDRFCKICGKRVNYYNTIYCSQTCANNAKINSRNQRIDKDGLAKNEREGKKYLISKRPHQCEICKVIEWQGKPVPLILDHINGHAENNSINNLRLICPNCDAQLATFKGRNKGNGRESRRKRYAEGKSY